MNAFRPEADTEYSRGEVLSGEDSGVATGRSATIRLAVLAGGMIGGVLLLAAEFMPLFTVHAGAHASAIRTVRTGSHHSYALLPVGVLAIGLAVSVWRTRSPLALLATAAMGLVALAIALLGDLPDAQATGLIGTASTGLATAASSPSAGLYTETLGAVVLLITAAAGMLLVVAPRSRRHRPRPASASRTRSAS